MASVEAFINKGLVITVLVDKFDNREKTLYSAVLSTPVTKKELLWHRQSARILQNVESHASSNFAYNFGEAILFERPIKKKRATIT